MSNSDHRPKVTIEDLLRLKRAERPEGDFWANFEIELRQKQLSALVEKRSWWQDLPQLLSRRAYLPIGATAILTFSLVSVKYYYPLQVAQSDGSSVVMPSSQNYSNETTPTASAAMQVSSPLVNRQEQPQLNQQEHASNLADAQALARDLAPQVLVGGDMPTKESPSARSIAANLAHLEQSEPELINAFLGSRLSSPVRVQQTASAPVVELASIPMNGSKRNRLLAHYTDRQLSTEPTAPDAVRERLSRRLDDSDFNDRFSRFGLKGDQVSLKF